MVTGYRHTRGKIKAGGTQDDPIYVVVDGISLTKYNKIGTVSAVPDTTKTTVVSQAYVAGTFENLVMATVSGEDYAKWYLTLNGSDIEILRTGPDRNDRFDFTGAPLQLQSGDIVDIKVEHFFGGSTLDFEATIYGYEA